MIVCDLSGKIRLYINNDGAGIRCTVACLFVLAHVYQAIFPRNKSNVRCSSFVPSVSRQFSFSRRGAVTPAIIRGNFTSNENSHPLRGKRTYV